jgi:hypothetical protein
VVSHGNATTAFIGGITHRAGSNTLAVTVNGGQKFGE